MNKAFTADEFINLITGRDKSERAPSRREHHQGYLSRRL